MKEYEERIVYVTKLDMIEAALSNDFEGSPYVY